MSEMNLIKPPKIGVAAEASAGHRMIGPARTDGRPVAQPKEALVSGQRRAGGNFGAAPGIQINRRGEAPVTKLAPQTIAVLRSTLTSMAKYCASVGGRQAALLTSNTLALVNAIAAGEDISDPPVPAPAPVIAKPPAPPAQVTPPAGTPTVTPPSSAPTAPVSASPTVGSPGAAK
jgi:hypothetical protein